MISRRVLRGTVFLLGLGRRGVCRRLLTVAIGWVLSLCLGNTLLAQHPEAEKAIDAWIAAAKRLESCSHVECLMKWGKPPHAHKTWRAMEYYKGCFAEEIINNDLPTTYVTIKNPQYWVELKREEGRPWVITKILLASDDEFDDYVFNHSDTNLFEQVTTCNGALKYLTDGKYEITSVNKQRVGENDYLVVEIKPDPDSVEILTKCTYLRFWFDQNGTCPFPKRKDYKTAGKRKSEITVVYSDWKESANRWLPQKIVSYKPILTDKEWAGDEKREPRVVFSFDYSEVDKKVDKSRFYLTHYGLPEPEGLERSYPFLYWVGAAVVVLFLFFFILWKKTAGANG